MLREGQLLLYFLYNMSSVMLCIALLLIMLVMVFAGYYIGREMTATDESSGTVEGALYGLTALLLAFTFSMAANGYDDRRHEMTNERNAISTVAACIQLYPDTLRGPMTVEFKKYLESRITLYKAGRNESKREAASGRCRQK